MYFSVVLSAQEHSCHVWILLRQAHSVIQVFVVHSFPSTWFLIAEGKITLEIIVLLLCMIWHHCVVLEGISSSNWNIQLWGVYELLFPSGLPRQRPLRPWMNESKFSLAVASESHRYMCCLKRLDSRSSLSWSINFSWCLKDRPCRRSVKDYTWERTWV